MSGCMEYNKFTLKDTILHSPKFPINRIMPLHICDRYSPVTRLSFLLTKKCDFCKQRTDCDTIS